MTDNNQCDISPSQIADILNKKRHKMFQYASYRVAEAEDIRDILQDLFLKLASKPCKLNDVGNIKAYAYRTLANLCSEKLRSREWKRNVSIDEFPTFEIEELSPTNFDDEFRMINKLLSTLPDDQSETIRLRIHSGLTFEEIADATEVNISTAKARFRYGIEKLRTGLKRQNLL